MEFKDSSPPLSVFGRLIIICYTNDKQLRVSSWFKTAARKTCSDRFDFSLDRTTLKVEQDNETVTVVKIILTTWGITFVRIWRGFAFSHLVNMPFIHFLKETNKLASSEINAHSLALYKHWISEMPVKISQFPLALSSVETFLPRAMLWKAFAL